MGYKRQNPPTGANGCGLQRDGQNKALNSTQKFTLLESTCQALTPQRRLKIAKIAQDLGLFAYDQVLARLDEPDEVFNLHFQVLAACVSIVQDHLREGLGNEP